MFHRRNHIIIIIAVLFISVFVCNISVEAKKYYSLEDIGLSGSATDNTDYSVLSFRGNTLRYVKYEKDNESGKWKKKGKSKKAKVSSKTKYYIGYSNKLRNRSVDPNSTKWIARVGKKTIKKKMSGRNNEIIVRKGKVIMFVTCLKR